MSGVQCRLSMARKYKGFAKCSEFMTEFSSNTSFISQGPPPKKGGGSRETSYAFIWMQEKTLCLLQESDS